MKPIFSQFQKITSPWKPGYLDVDDTYDPRWGMEPFVVVSGEKVYPFHDLDVARKAELAAEQQALSNLNHRIADSIDSTVIPVKFQFLLSADKKTFKIGYVDHVFVTQEQALAFIYR